MGLLCFLLLPTSHSYGQQKTLRGINILQCNESMIDFELDLGDVTAELGPDGFTWLKTDAANGTNMTAGLPMLPQFRQLIVLPLTIEPMIETSCGDMVSLSLTSPIATATGARTKQGTILTTSDSVLLPRQNEAFTLPLAQLETLGTMRGEKVARLTVAPFTYFPEQNKVEYPNRIRVTIRFKPDTKTQQSFHDNAISDLLPHWPTESHAFGKDYNNELTVSPYLFLVVSTTRFRNSLQTFLQWKREEGCIVEEYYNDSGDADSIKQYLQQRYDNATQESPAPLFIMLVGDNDDIPRFNGQHRINGIAPHITDLYYAEFTGDYLPDALLGRISVNSIEELDNIMAKTIAYEQGLMESFNYLSRSVLVAGREDLDPAPTTTNGQVNYMKNLLMHHDQSHDTICFYNPDSDSQRQTILSTLENGQGLVCYTAHCLRGGWRNPTITNVDIDSLPETGHLFLAVNNCCQTNNILGDSFGEHLIRKANGGAIGVIGACSETLWDEDFFWSVGNRDSIDINPYYDPDNNGAFGALLHPHHETDNQHAITQSQMVMAGNWAVMRSGSPYDAFYWEVYNLLGDPSLMPYIGIPENMSLQVDSIVPGSATVSVTGTPGARVAATHRDTLLGICQLDSTGFAQLTTSLPMYGNIKLTATKQFYKPIQLVVAVSPDSTLAIERPDDEENRFTLFPNPASDVLTVSGFDEETTILITNSLGHQILTLTAHEGETLHIPTQRMATGCYFVVFSNQKQTKTKKIIVTR